MVRPLEVLLLGVVNCLHFARGEYFGKHAFYIQDPWNRHEVKFYVQREETDTTRYIVESTSEREHIFDHQEARVIEQGNVWNDNGSPVRTTALDRNVHGVLSRERGRGERMLSLDRSRSRSPRNRLTDMLLRPEPDGDGQAAAEPNGQAAAELHRDDREL